MTHGPLRTVEDRLRSLIIGGDFQPSSWIREEALASKLGVSRTPIREACARLSTTGLLEHIPRRGFRLPKLDVAELQDVYPVVVALEVTAIEMIDSENTKLAERLSELNFNLQSPPSSTQEFAKMDYSWHHELVAASGNRILTKHFAMLYAQIARFIHFYWTQPCVESSRREHQQIADAVRQGDAELAIALLKSHRRIGLERICKLIAEKTGDS